MPIYEYRCRACTHEFEVLVRHTEAAPQTCVACQAAGLERLVSSCAVRTDTTRQSIVQSARRDNVSVIREKGVAAREAIEKHG